MPTKALSKPCSTSTNNQVTALLGGFNGFRLNNCAHDNQSTRPLSWPPRTFVAGIKISEGAKVQCICALRLGWVGVLPGSLWRQFGNTQFPLTDQAAALVRPSSMPSCPPPTGTSRHAATACRAYVAGRPYRGHKWQVCSELVTLRHSFLYWKPRPMRHSARIATPI